jgi:hypothetical protein
MIINSVEQSPSWDTNKFSASQEMPPYCMEEKGSLSHSQAPYLSHISPAQAPHPTS